MKTHKLLLLPAMLALSLLSACGSVKQELGIGRNSPDEFTVVKRAPLTLPPDYALRPPSLENTRPASDASDQARTAVLGRSLDAAAEGASEQTLLGKLGAANADP